MGAAAREQRWRERQAALNPTLIAILSENEKWTVQWTKNFFVISKKCSFRWGNRNAIPLGNELSTRSDWLIILQFPCFFLFVSMRVFFLCYLEPSLVDRLLTVLLGSWEYQQNKNSIHIQEDSFFLFPFVIVSLTPCLRVGNRITSLMEAESVSIITKRSTPSPQPEVGGNP